MLNIPRRHEPVATNTVFSDTPAVDSGVKQAQVFVGRDTLVDRSQNYTFFCIYLHYISFALHLHFICISHNPRN